jgi:ATP-dependent exoDNAse (exonuclease V) beta subunit
MIDYEKELNPEQYRVVMEKGGPLLVLAGAGSGKTRTLTYRVARLLEAVFNRKIFCWLHLPTRPRVPCSTAWRV